MRRLLLAKYVATMTGPPIRSGGVLVEDGVIVDVGAESVLCKSHGRPDAIEHLGDVVLMPGLINAHVHLELTGVGRPAQPASFVDWILALQANLRGRYRFEEFVRESCLMGVAQCLFSGVTTVGDITGNPAITRPLVGEHLRGISFGEVLGMAGRSEQFKSRFDAALRDGIEPDSKIRAGMEPHAPYSLDLRHYAQCVSAARGAGVLLTTHLAETRDESEFLARHTGEFRRLWDAIGGWGEGVSRFEGGTIRAMEAIGLLDLPAILAHVNYADDEELAILAQGQASVVYSPRTHAYFRHPPHRWREMLARGINVAIGTDSAASSGDLNIVDDLRLLHRQNPDVPAQELWSLVTTRAATAMGMSNQIGDLWAGKKADLCAFPVRGEDPLREVLESDAVCAGVWVEGEEKR